MTVHDLSLDELLRKVSASPRGCEPIAERVFRAFELTPPESVKVIILGQDPYHDGSADGLSFSVRENARLPRSLGSILRVLKVKNASHGDLVAWAKDGVLLLNSVLTVRRGRVNSDRNRGWQGFTSAVVRAMASDPKRRVVLMLWGASAGQVVQSLPDAVRSRRGLRILRSSHPSPNRRACETRLKDGSLAFLEAHHFQKANVFLRGAAVNWKAPWTGGYRGPDKWQELNVAGFEQRQYGSARTGEQQP